MKKILSVLRPLVPDLLMMAGIVGIARGAAMIYVPAGWVVAGAFAFAFGMLLARRTGEP